MMELEQTTGEEIVRTKLFACDHLGHRIWDFQAVINQGNPWKRIAPAFPVTWGEMQFAAPLSHLLGKQSTTTWGRLCQLGQTLLFPLPQLRMADNRSERLHLPAWWINSTKELYPAWADPHMGSGTELSQGQVPAAQGCPSVLGSTALTALAPAGTSHPDKEARTGAENLSQFILITCVGGVVRWWWLSSHLPLDSPADLWTHYTPAPCSWPRPPHKSAGRWIKCRNIKETNISHSNTSGLESS